MIIARLRGPGGENKGQPEASNEFLYSDMKTQAIQIGQWESKNRAGALEAYRQKRQKAGSQY